MKPLPIARRVAGVAAVLTVLTALAAAAAPAQSGGTSRLLVKFRTHDSAAAHSTALAQVGAKEVGSVRDLGVHVLSVGSARAELALRLLRANPAVAFVEADAQAQRFDTIPNDPWWLNEWAQVKVGAPKAWDLTHGSSSVVVAVLDTGVDPTQPDLQGALVPGWNTLAGSSNTTDTDGHGTLAAGVALARSNNGTGIASYCWSCSLMPVKVIDTGGMGSFSSVANGITWATDHGARVISMSLGFTSSSSTLQSAVQYAHSHGVVIVAAAGNYGTTAPVYPAAYPEVLGTAGTDGSDQLYSWSSYGSWVKLAAPGCNVTTGPNAWYGTFCGTSSAAPVVAGLAGLAVSYAPLASNTQIEQALESAAAKVGASVQYGRVDAYQTLVALGAGSTAAGSAPASVTAPSISGTPRDGQTLLGSNGTWTGSPTSYADQWSRCDSAGASCAIIPGATASTYGVTSADVGATLRFAVSASNSVGSSSAVSSATAVVAAAPAAASPGSASFSGTLNNKQSQQSFKLAVGSGATQASLSFSKQPSLTLTVYDTVGGTVGTASGPSIVKLVQTLGAGTYTFQVSGGGKSGCSFTLNVSYQVPPA
jgi:subtilisin family serine protease